MSFSQQSASGAFGGAQSIPRFANCNVLVGSISYERCSRYSGAERNASMCAGCSSPARQCFACYRQGVPAGQCECTNPISGLCDFHEEYGKDAKKPWIDPKAMGSAAKTSSYPPLDPEVVAKIPGHLVACGVRAYPKLNSTQRAILGFHARGVTRPRDIAAALNCTENTVYQAQAGLQKRLGFNTEWYGHIEVRPLRTALFSLIHQRVNPD